MNRIDKIKKNFYRKRKMSLKEEAIRVNDNHGIYKISMILMTIYAVFISFAVYAKKDESALLINSVFNTNIDFKSFNSKMNDFLDLRIFHLNDKLLESEAVSGEVEYIYLGEDYYVSESNMVVALKDGLVSYVNGKDDNYFVIVEYDNGVRANYYDLVEVNVFSGDRVYENDIIGSYNDKVKMIFIKNNKKLEYEDIIISN